MQATRRRIIDAATSMVEARGFDAVTIEEICAEAAISRRTFFNYMDSKEEAVLGTLPVRLNEEVTKDLIETPSDNLVISILQALGNDMMARIDRDFEREVQQRRLRIYANEPHLLLNAHKRFRDLSESLHEIAERHYEEHPEARAVDKLSASEEASLVVTALREALMITHIHNFDVNPATIWCTNAHNLYELLKGMTW